MGIIIESRRGRQEHEAKLERTQNMLGNGGNTAY